MDKRKDRQMGRRTDGRTDGQVDRQTDEHTNKRRDSESVLVRFCCAENLQNDAMNRNYPSFWTVEIYLE